MRVFGLTGGIASGKSTVSDLVRAQGVPVIDSDQVAREVVASGTPGLVAVRQAFGPGVLKEDGTLDREALGKRVFSDSDARARLNAILHPLIQAATAEQVLELSARGEPLAILDIPLLYEVRDPAQFEGVIVVYVDPATQLERLMVRNGYSRDEAEARIASQLPIQEKARRATFVIDNSGTRNETIAQVALLVGRLRHIADQAPK